MSIHTLKKPSNVKTQNSYGETPLPFAPQVTMADGNSVIPQQYLDVTRDLASLEAVINQINFSDRYPIFAGEINQVLYLQVGVIGSENYPTNEQQKNEVKIVYGRRWLIEPTTTSSEVVQTAMLAIKKAREHELREKVVKTINQGKSMTTPFNTHMDLPQMVGSAKSFAPTIKTIQQQLRELEQTVCVDDMKIKVHKTQDLGAGRTFVELNLVEASDAKQNEPSGHFPEISGQRLGLLCDSNSSTELMHELMAQLVTLSDRHVEETLNFEGFKRFSRSVCVQKIAEFSYQSRNIPNKDPRFADYFKEMSYQVDSTKAPFFSDGELGNKQRAALRKYNVIAGYTPNEDDDTLTLHNTAK